MAVENWIEDFNKCLDAWDGKYIITSPDIDGFLSAAAICHHRRNEFNPPEIIGIYTARHIVLFDDYSLDDAKKAIWLDHDITHNEVLCLGQHLYAYNLVILLTGDIKIPSIQICGIRVSHIPIVSMD